ncbi:MAG: alkaline phosphatase family protein, partial [Vicinamibacterales bacterium]
MKPRVLLVVIDGWTSRLLEPELQAGHLPCLQELASRGRLWFDCVSIFPSITPAATASILTGRYPAEHGILGMSWWNPDTRDVFYLGADVRTILKRGAGDFLNEFLLRLNGERLRAATMFSLVEREHLTAGCFNHLIFRGDVPHPVAVPPLLRLLSSVRPGVQVHGPTRLRLGQFVPGAVAQRPLATLGGTLNRFGLDDEGTERFLAEVKSSDDLPDFSVAYFADYDFAAHEQGPTAALETLRRIDARLSRILGRWGGIGPVLDRVCLFLTADHAHSDIRGDTVAGIALDRVRSRYRCGSPADGWQPRDELLLCPNMRSLEIYARDPEPGLLNDLARDTLQDARVDQVIWRDGGNFVVLTTDRGTLR